MSQTRDVKVVYRRWTIIIPIAMIIVGLIMMYGFWLINPAIGFFGGTIAFIGILTFGILLVMMISLELSTRSLKRRRPTPPPLSEEFEQIQGNRHTEEEQ